MQSFFPGLIAGSYLKKLVNEMLDYQIDEDLLELVDHLAKIRRHEQGLEQTVHVAGCTLVAKSFVNLLLLFLRRLLCHLHFALNRRHLLVVFTLFPFDSLRSLLPFCRQTGGRSRRYGWARLLHLH